MKIKYVALAVAPLLSLFLSGVALATPGASGGAYGSFAYSPAKHSVVFVGYGSTSLKAEEAAEAQCGKHAKDCLPVVWFEHAYATFEVGTKNSWSWGTSSTLAGADKNASNWCSTHGGANCHVILRAVTTSPSTAVTQSDLKARMCMVNAPTGVIHFAGYDFIGHVGWAYLKNRDTGQWEYGANEGPSKAVLGIPQLGSPSKTWIRDGAWTQLTTAFAKALGKGKNKTYFHAAGFYKTFRCSSEPVGYNSDAHAKAESQQNKPYTLSLTTPGNDCLSNAVDVLAADGDPGLANDAGLPNVVPNWYYAHGLYNFAPSAKL